LKFSLTALNENTFLTFDLYRLLKDIPLSTGPSIYASIFQSHSQSQAGFMFVTTLEMDD